MKSIVTISTIIILLVLGSIAVIPTVHAQDFDKIEQELDNMDLSNVPDGETIDLREEKEKPPIWERYLFDILIIVGAVGVIETLLWLWRKTKTPRENPKRS